MKVSLGQRRPTSSSSTDDQNDQHVVVVAAVVANPAAGARNDSPAPPAGNDGDEEGTAAVAGGTATTTTTTTAAAMGTTTTTPTTTNTGGPRGLPPSGPPRQEQEEGRIYHPHPLACIGMMIPPSTETTSSTLGDRQNNSNMEKNDVSHLLSRPLVGNDAAPPSSSAGEGAVEVEGRAASSTEEDGGDAAQNAARRSRYNGKTNCKNKSGSGGGVNYCLAPLQCFKRTDRNDDKNDDEVGLGGDSDEVPSSPMPTTTTTFPLIPKPAPPGRRSTTTTLSTMESSPGEDEADDGRGGRGGEASDTLMVDDNDDNDDEDNEPDTPGTLELRDVGKDAVDCNGDGDGGVEVTIRQYLWKVRWDRFYYGLLRRRTTPISRGCYYSGQRPRDAKFVLDDTEDDHDSAEQRRRRRRWRLFPILISLGVATIVLVIVAAASACRSGRCSSSTNAVASSTSSPPNDNDNNMNTPQNGGTAPSTASSSPPTSSAPSSSSAPMTTGGSSVTPTPTPLRPLTISPWMDRTPEPTWAKTNPVTLTSTTDLYCYPTYSARTRYSNAWPSTTTSNVGYTVEVKEGSYCGPGNNDFSSATVNFDAADGTLVLQYRQVNGRWTGSEVRVVLPDSLMPYTYGTYSFSIQNVTFTDMYGQPKNGNVLSEDLVVGFFTWDDTERYDVHENWNHEVDVEISRWGDPSLPDAQFLIQPPEVPHLYRFYSGVGDTVNPGAQTYQFTWYPTNITWHASGTSESYAYTTRMALEQNLPDRIQCLPANVEVRMNLWNRLGADVSPSGMSDTDVAQVVIDNFSFTPAGVVGVDDGQLCSKHCQCSGDTSMCVSSVCTPV